MSDTDHQSIASHFERELISANAEIERLKAYLGDAQAWEAHLKGEIERLDNVWRDMSAEIVDLNAEIKRQKNCYIKIIRESLDTGEYERSLGQTIVDRIRDLDQEDKG